MNNYIKRKNNELEALAQFLNVKNLKRYNNIKDIQLKKEDLVKKLRKENNKKFYHSLTNHNQLCFKTEHFDYKYTYERFNGFINIPAFANNFYNIGKKNNTQTFFTNCGMSAIAALLTSIISSNNIGIDLLYEETYFETIKYIQTLLKGKYIKKALYIDTIASDFSFKISKEVLDKYSFVIIDTTCFLGHKFQELINDINSYNIPCILVRSHTKLDLLATEYSHIGSVSFVYPTLSKDKIKEMLLKIQNDCQHLIGVFGACLPPEKFPQFILDKEIIKYNKKRIDIVSKHNEKFFDFVVNKKIKIELPTHKQFCLIYLENVNYTLSELKEKIIEFCNENSNKIPIHHAVSFGFDYIALDCYQNFIDNTFKIRICISDLPSSIIHEFAKLFLNFLESLYN